MYLICKQVQCCFGIQTLVGDDTFESFKFLFERFAKYCYWLWIVVVEGVDYNRKRVCCFHNWICVSNGSVDMFLYIESGCITSTLTMVTFEKIICNLHWMNCNKIWKSTSNLKCFLFSSLQNSIFVTFK